MMFGSEAPFLDEAALRAAPTNYEEVMPKDYENLTRHYLNEDAVSLAQRITAETDAPYDKAKAVEAWLSSSAFSYSLDVPAYGGSNPINEFLLKGRRGHCQLFATAMALMLRSQGIPTRVVSGYRGGDWNESDKSYLVLQSHAHLWVEVYIIGHGWLPFDPSPQADRFELIRSRFSRVLAKMGLRANLFWYRNVISYSGGLSYGVFRQFLASWFDEGASIGSSGKTSFSIPRIQPLIPVIGFLGVIIGMYALYVLVRAENQERKFGALTEDQRRAVRLFLRFKREAARLGLPCEGRTAGELLELAMNVASLDMQQASHILAIYERARFGRAPLSSGLYAQLMRAVRKIRRTS